MGCSSCNKNMRAAAPSMPGVNRGITGVAKNLATAATGNNGVFRWFRDGITGLVKCALGQQSYSDEDIAKNRDICRGCEHSTKTDGKLTIQSQCMRPDPNNNNAPCACFITCKTQVGACDKWTTLTINSAAPKPILNSDTPTEI